MTIQNGNSWRAYFNIVEEIVKELFGDSVRPRTQIIRFLLPIVLAFGITWLFLCLVLRDLLQVHSIDGQEPSIVVFRWLERLPTTPTFYYFIAALAGAYMGKRWCSYANLCRKFAARRQNDDECDLTPRDWWVVQGLRERAFFLRTRAAWILGGIFLLLVMGVYFTIFILPSVGESDESIRREIRQQQYRDKIGNVLSSLSEGRYWIKVRDIPEGLRTDVDESREDAYNGKMDANISLDISVIKSEHEKENSTPEKLGVSLRSDEWITAAAFSADGRIGVIAGDRGSVMQTADGGEIWDSPDLLLGGGEWITAAAFSADGGIGVVAGDEGSVFRTANKGERWESLNLDLKGGERIITAAFSADGGIGVVAGDEGSVFRTANKGERWESLNLDLKGGERIIAAAFSADGGIGVVAGNRGSVFRTTNKGESWDSLDLLLEGRERFLARERIIAAAFGADGGIGVVVSDDGRVFRTTDKWESWESLNLSLKGGERIIAAAFSADGRIGVVASREGSVFQTTDHGKSWDPMNLSPLEREGSIVATAFGTNTQIMIYHATSAVELSIADENWKSFDVPVEWGERITAVAFSADKQIGVIAGDEGSVFQTTDGGERWDSIDLSLKWSEGITATAFSSANGGIGVVASDKGSVFRTTGSGEKWESTEIEDYISPERVFELQKGSDISGRKGDVSSDVTFVLEADDGAQYFLRNHEQLDNWRDMSLVEIYDAMKDDDILENVRIIQDITEFLYESESVVAETGEDDEGFFGILDNSLTVMRTVTLVSLLILVHILVRLHRYSVRLAAFWDARADAVLLAQSFARCKAETFDDLAAVFAPDAYDFKPTPRLEHESATKLLRQVLRGESRTS